MSFTAIKHIFHQKTLFCAHMKSPAHFISTTNTVFAKKRFKMKNNFAFQREFLENQNFDTEQKANSNVHFGSSDSSDHTKSNRFLSADLLSGESAYSKRYSAERKHQPEKINKPSLSYQGEILFGVHPVYLALLQKKRTFYHLFALKDVDSSSQNNLLKAEIVKLAKSMDIPVSFVDSRGLKILAPGAVHQGICLDTSYLPSITWKEDQLTNDVVQKQRLWLVLDQVIDPMNVGAVMRSAYYFGVDKLFTVKGNSCKLSPTVSKASSGALEVMDIYQIDNLEDFIKHRKAGDWCVVSTVAYLENKSEFNKPFINVEDLKTSKPTVLILGNEGRGISEDILKLCDSLISIQPGQALYQGIDSLNVSVAAGVLLYVLNSHARNVKR